MGYKQREYMKREQQQGKPVDIVYRYTSVQYIICITPIIYTLWLHIGTDSNKLTVYPVVVINGN